MWLVLVASVAFEGSPRQIRLPRLSPPPYRLDLPEPSIDIRPAQVVLDGWAFYARGGGMLVATGQATQPFVYDCDTRWDGGTPLCRVGRSALKMPNHFFILLGMSFTTIQDALRRLHPDDKQRLRQAVAWMPLINFSVLENGAYGNLLLTI